MPFITDRLFSNVDTVNIKTDSSGEVENATSYGIFSGDLKNVDLLTSSDLNSHLPSHQSNGATAYTLDEYLEKTWQETKGKFTTESPSGTDHELRVAIADYHSIAGVGIIFDDWDYDDDFHLLGAYDNLTANSGAAIKEKITNNNSVTDIPSAQALLARAGIDSEAEAEQLVANILAIYEENDLKATDSQSHIFKVDMKLASGKAVEKDDGEYSAGHQFTSNYRRMQDYDNTTLNVDVDISLNYSMILRAALQMANNSATVPSQDDIADSLFEYLHDKYSSEAGITIREDFTAGKLHRNLIPEAFTNTYAIEAVAADAKAITGVDLATMEKNYNINHPGKELYLTPGMWNGSSPSYEVVLEQAKQYRQKFKDSAPGRQPGESIYVDVGTVFWQEFMEWEKNLDPDKKFIQENSYWRQWAGDPVLAGPELDGIDQALENLITTIEQYQTAKDYQQKFAEYAQDDSLLISTYPSKRELDTNFWQGFVQWAQQVDPSMQYIKQDSYDRANSGDSVLSDAEFKSIGEALASLIGPLKEPLYPLDVEQDRYLMKDRFMQSHRFYLGTKERQYRDTADELSDLNKMLDEARHWQEWIGKFEREDDEDYNLAEENLEKYNKFYAWIVSSDIASPKANKDYEAYIDWKGEYGNNPDLDDEELTLLNTDITNYIQSLENRSNLVTVDANQHLTRYNESLEFLSAVLKRVMTTLDNVLSNVKG